MKVLLVALALGMCSIPQTGWASVGKVGALEGDATRQARGSKPVALSVGNPIQLGDLLAVVHGHLKVELSDESTLVLPEGSQLRIEGAEFEGQERKRVSLRLIAGSVWAGVIRTLADDAPFEVQTERAVAGVRGTILQVDAVGKGEALVFVEDGEVAVRGSGATGAVQRVSAGEAFHVSGPGLFERIAAPRRSAAFERFLTSIREEHRARQRHRIELRQQRKEIRQELREIHEEMRERRRDRNRSPR